jgi:hypothetical protein
MMHTTPVVGTVMGIVVWLRSRGLGKYEAAFRENDLQNSPGITLSVSEREVARRNIGVMLGGVDAA